MKRTIGLILLAALFALAKDEPTSTIADELSNATHAVTLLREQLRDPDSLVVERVYGSLSHKPGHPMICIVYRARNGFNGYERDIAEYRGAERIETSTLGPEGFGRFGSHCESVKRDWTRALKHGWADFTEDYAKANPK